MTDFAIRINHLRKNFAMQRDIIRDLSFALPAGASLSLLGPSGCGKTTLLRLIMGLEQPSAGSIEIDPPLRAQMTYVFQEPRLVPWRTALENVLLPLELQSEKNSDATQHAIELLHKLGLGERLHHFPHELSGGMQMRTALARALVTKPRLLLLDEPFAALDERTRFRLQDLLLELKSTLSLQYVFVTHSIAEAVYLGDQVLLMNRNGNIDTVQSIELGARNQDTKLSAEFIAIAKQFSQRFFSIEAAEIEAAEIEADEIEADETEQSAAGQNL